MTHRSPKPAWARAVATVGGAGYFPIAPGTVGALVALPFARGLGRLGPFAKVAALGALSVAAWVAVDAYLAGADDADPSEVVVDELVGCLIALAFVPARPAWALGAFALFRAFDIAKPGPVGWAERELPGAAGVMGDDIVAGLFAGGMLGLAARALGRAR